MMFITPHTADGKCHRADDSEQYLQRDRECNELFAILDGVPCADSLFVQGIEMMTLREYGSDSL